MHARAMLRQSRESNKCEGARVAEYPRALSAETIEKEGMCGVETIKKERKRGASVILIHYKSTVPDGSIAL